MRPFHVIMLAIFRTEMIEVRLAKHHEMVEAFLLQRLDESLDVSVSVR